MLPRLIALLTLGPWMISVEAQCPDGTPPPCAKAPIKSTRMAKVEARLRVVVMPFVAQGRDPSLADVGHMAADVISGQLARTGLLDVISPAAGPRAPEDSRSVDGLRLARDRAARWVVDGTIYRIGDSLQLVSRILDARDGHIAATLGPYRASAAWPASAITELGRQLIPALATRTDRTLAGWANRLSAPPTYESYAAYTQGVRLFVQRRSREAIPLYRDIIARDSGFTAARLWLAAAYWDIGDLQHADSVASAVETRGVQLTDVEQLWIDWIHASCQGRLDDAYEASLAKNRLVPGSDLFELITAYDALRTARPHSSVAQFERLDPRSSWMKETIIYSEYFTAALHVTANHVRELAVSRDAQALHPSQAAPIRSEVRALSALRRVAELNDVLARKGGERLADLNRLAASELYAHGDSASAVTFRQAALQSARSALLAQPTNAALRLGLARVLYEHGQLDEAATLFRNLANEQPSDLETHARLGTIAARRGDTVVADSVDRWLSSMQGPYVNGAHTLWRARLAAARGQRDLAVALIRQARSEGASFSVSLHSDPDFARSLAGYDAFERLVRPRQ